MTQQSLLAVPEPAKPAAAPKLAAGKAAVVSLSYTERHRLDALPGVIARLEAEISKLSDFLSDPQLFSREPKKFEKASSGLAERQAALAAAEEEWLSLAERAEQA